MQTEEEQIQLERDSVVDEFNHSAREALQGVVRLGVTALELAMIFNEIPSIGSYVITLEEEPSIHLHFLLWGHKKLAINPLKKQIKSFIPKLKKPKIYLNGMLNISRVVNPFTMLTYIYKEHDEEWFIANTKNVPRAVIQLAKDSSYRKGYDLQKRVSKIINDVRNKLLTPFEATVKYGLLRKSYGKPDLNIITFYRKMEVEFQSDEEYEINLRDLLNLKEW